MIKVWDLYQITKAGDIPLLSDFTATAPDFWTMYRTNYKEFDRTFARLYKSFVPYMQDLPRTIFDKPTPEYIKEIQEEFTLDVKSWLSTNQKKYAELYREYLIADSDYSLTDNYKMIEFLHREGTGNDTLTDGIRSDVTTLKVGEKIDKRDEVYGTRLDKNDVTIGEQTNSSTESVSPYDSSNFSNDTKVEDNVGGKTDVTMFNKGEQTDKTTITSGAKIDETTISKGEQINKKSTENKEDYTLKSSGNNGSKSATEVLEQHNRFWKDFEFYTYIFSDIAKSLFLVD